MTTKVSRRRFYQLIGAASGALIAGCSIGGPIERPTISGVGRTESPPSSGQQSTLATETAGQSNHVYREFHAAGLLDELDDPDEIPALAVTYTGVYQFRSRDRGWEWTRLLSGTAENPIPEQHVQALATKTLATPSRPLADVLVLPNGSDVVAVGSTGELTANADAHAVLQYVMDTAGEKHVYVARAEYTIGDELHPAAGQVWDFTRTGSFTASESVPTGAHFFRTTSGGVELRGGAWDGNDRIETFAHLRMGSDYRIEDLEIRGVTHEGVVLAGVSGAKIRDLYQTGGDYGIRTTSLDGAVTENVRIRDVEIVDTSLNAVAMYAYADDFVVSDSTGRNNGHSSFAASPATNGKFIGCFAEGVTEPEEAGFEAEYKPNHDPDDRRAPSKNIQFIGCTARNCTRGLMVREDPSSDLGVGAERTLVSDFHAVDCETGIYLGPAAVETQIYGASFENCTTDIVDDGVRTLVNGRGTNAGDPTWTGQWRGHAAYAYQANADILDTTDGIWYRATADGRWNALTS